MYRLIWLSMLLLILSNFTVAQNLEYARLYRNCEIPLSYIEVGFLPFSEYHFTHVDFDVDGKRVYRITQKEVLEGYEEFYRHSSQWENGNISRWTSYHHAVFDSEEHGSVNEENKDEYHAILRDLDVSHITSKYAKCSIRAYYGDILLQEMSHYCVTKAVGCIVKEDRDDDNEDDKEEEDEEKYESPEIDEISISNPPTYGYEFKVTARISQRLGTIEFFVDDLKFASKNVAGSSSTAIFKGEENWEKIGCGEHEVIVKLYDSESRELVDTDSREILVDGCITHETTTTTTTLPKTIICNSNSDCRPTTRGIPYCKDRHVVEFVEWGECENPGTTESVCVLVQQESVLTQCLPNEQCNGGVCLALTTTSSISTISKTTISSTLTTILPETNQQKSDNELVKQEDVGLFSRIINFVLNIFKI
jgi:hypothetical protein